MAGKTNSHDGDLSGGHGNYDFWIVKLSAANNFFYADADGDGYGNPNSVVSSCSALAGYVADDSDCNDASAAIHPGMTDICNSLDDNCDGNIDENSISAVITPSGTIDVCSGTSVVLDANSSTGLTYQWLKNNVAISGATNETYTPKKTASYAVKETNSFSCTSTSSSTAINILVKPSAIITPLDALDICLLGSVILQANIDPGLAYQWKKGGSLISGATNQLYIATAEGTYRVIVTGTNGCSKTSTGVTVTNSCRQNSVYHDNVENPFTIFPNPAAGKFMIDIELNHEENSEAVLQVINVLGQMVHEEQIPVVNSLLQKEIQLNTVANGFYTVKVIINNRIYSRPLLISE